jgi:hypothetical protein
MAIGDLHNNKGVSLLPVHLHIYISLQLSMFLELVRTGVIMTKQIVNYFIRSNVLQCIQRALSNLAIVLESHDQLAIERRNA